MRRDDTLRMAREAGLCTSTGACALVGGADLTPFLQRFADLAVADFLAHTPPPPIMVSAADIDLELLRNMLTKAPHMPILPMPTEPTPEAVAAAVAAEREACAQVCDAKAHEVRLWCNESNVIACAAAIRARGAA